jgi:2-C-methyl-D-erythritol 2,4-cyclodiphosphate synthase
MKIGFGYDSHRFAQGKSLFLGGVNVPHDKGLLGHSDADVLLHAIGDAILGAIGEGDLGSHFPDNDPAYKGISSAKLLSRINEMVIKKGLRINNIDSTIVLESPRLDNHKREMVETIARLLDISEESVNVKASTNEGMGFTGRGEGIAAFAVVTVKNA